MKYTKCLHEKAVDCEFYYRDRKQQSFIKTEKQIMMDVAFIRSGSVPLVDVDTLMYMYARNDWFPQFLMLHTKDYVSNTSGLQELIGIVNRQRQDPFYTFNPGNHTSEIRRVAEIVSYHYMMRQNVNYFMLSQREARELIKRDGIELEIIDHPRFKETYNTSWKIVELCGQRYIAQLDPYIFYIPKNLKSVLELLVDIFNKKHEDTYNFTIAA